MKIVKKPRPRPPRDTKGRFCKRPSPPPLDPELIRGLNTFQWALQLPRWHIGETQEPNLLSNPRP